MMRLNYPALAAGALATLLAVAPAIAGDITGPPDLPQPPPLTPAQQQAQFYFERIPLTAVPAAATDLHHAMAFQAELVEALSVEMGKVVGYKAGLTSPAAQQSFGVTTPLRGTLLWNMLIPSGRTLPAGFGVKPMLEADLIVQVGDAVINEATTPEQAWAAIDGVVPFMELPDLPYSAEVPLTAVAIAAVNVGARYGIIGPTVPVTAADHKRVRGAFVTVSNQEGAILAQGALSNLMGDPARAVLWLVESLRADGIRLKVGQVLSLGSVTAPVPVPESGMVFVRYDGLSATGPTVIMVRFTP